MTGQKIHNMTITLFIMVIFTSYFMALSHVKYARADDPYVFGVIPQFEQRKLYAIWNPIIDELQKQTGLAFKLVTTLQIQDFEKQYLNGNFDFAYMNPYLILKGRKSQGYIPLVRDKAPLRGILVVRKDSAVKSVYELNGKTVAFPSPNALGASLLIRADLEKLFNTAVTPLYVKTHSSVYLHVVKGIVAAGGGVEKTLQEQEPVIRDSLRVLYTTREMPAHPFAAHPRVAKEQREKVRRALLDMDAGEKGRKLLSKIPTQKIITAGMDDYEAMQTWGLDAYWDPFWRED